MPARNVTAIATPTRHCISGLIPRPELVSVVVTTDPPVTSVAYRELTVVVVVFRRSESNDEALPSQLASFTAVPTIRLITANVPTPSNKNVHQ